MTIGELQAKTGVPAYTIRYWERIGVLPKAARVSGQRRYGNDAVHRLAVLRLAQACGFRLDEMRHLFHGFQPGVTASERWLYFAQKKKFELNEQMARLRAIDRVLDSVSHCQCMDLADCGRIAASVRTKPATARSECLL